MAHSEIYSLPDGIEITGEMKPEYYSILSPQAISFIALLQREFNPRRKALLDRRTAVQAQLRQGGMPTFPAETASLRSDLSWKVVPPPADLKKRWVEITGPTDRKMLINALNSGADVFMADFEDANSPTWQNMVEGQINLSEAIARKITYTGPDGKYYRLNEKVAVLLVRPRGWHLVEKHLLVDGEPVSGSLFDFGLYLFHNARRLLEQGTGPYFYLAKLENHLEAELWNEVFIAAQQALDIPRGTIRATVLIETILAAFEMEEILFSLREHSIGLNAGRWDYIFSVIKKFHSQPDFILPDRSQITMTVPYMRAYTELLVRSCHKRGAYAMGGMAAFIPSRKDPQANEIALSKVRDDKIRESKDGFDGTWVAHPDLVPVAIQIFSAHMGDRVNQLDRLREDVQVAPAELTNFNVPGGRITEAGLRQNISVAVQYLKSWLRGTGAVALYNLMEDTATAEISRAQVWQWLHHGASLDDGRKITRKLFNATFTEELEKIRAFYGEEYFRTSKFQLASQLFETLATQEDFADFLTLSAYDHF